MKRKIIFINSHPIQYFAPLYKFMNEQGLETIAWYCSDESIKGKIDKEFGVEVKWDIPILSGYKYEFFENNSWKPSISNGFFGLINLRLIKKLFTIPKSVLIVHGYHYFTLFAVLMLGKLLGHTVCIRCDVPYHQRKNKKGLLHQVTEFGFKYVLFPRINYFLYVGKQNRLFYQSQGVASQKLISCPYAVDNDRFNEEYLKLSDKVYKIKQDLGIPPSAKVIVYSGKYIDKKRPLDLIKAVSQLNREDLWLIMIGEGKLRGVMEGAISKLKFKNVILTGFVNQLRIAEFYAIGNLFVMCSSFGENWGLSVNEAMNFDLPLVISDLTGCADDLVLEGVNGYIFKTGDVNELEVKIEDVLYNNKLTNDVLSSDIVENYSYLSITDSIRSLKYDAVS